MDPATMMVFFAALFYTASIAIAYYGLEKKSLLVEQGTPVPQPTPAQEAPKTKKKAKKRKKRK